MTNLISFNECHSLVQIGIALLMQSSIILLLGLALGLFLRRHGPLAASAVYRATLTAVVVMGLTATIASPYLPSVWHVSLPEASAVTRESRSLPPLQTAASPQAQVLPMTPVKTTTSMSQPTVIPPTVTMLLTRPSAANSHWYAIIVIVWGLGAAGLFSWLIIGQIYLFRLRRDSTVLTSGTTADLLHSLCPEHTTRLLTLRTSPKVQSPFLAGIRRPAIFLPAAFEQDFGAEQQKMILAHEVAHWRHRDNIWVLFMRLTCSALWWQPLLWLLAHRMTQASEEACDVAALTMGCPAQPYADCLLSLAERLLPTHLERSLGNGVVPYRSSLAQRIQVILRSPRQQALPAWFRPAVALTVAIGMVLGLRLISGADAPASPVDVVRQYIADCTTGQLAQAYRLLSSRTQGYVAYTWFSRPYLASPDAVRRYPPTSAIEALFREPRDPNIRFEVAGNDPKYPNNVLVRAFQPGSAGHADATISVVTLADPKTGSPKLDFVQTVQPFDPGIVQRLEAGRLQRECASHITEIGLAIINYIQDHDEHFPHADRWMDEIMPYLKDASLLHDPAMPASQKYSYAFNSNLSGVSVSRVNSPAELVMIFDSSKGTRNASDTGQSLPSPGRHTYGNDYVFVDGHMKWLRNSHRPSFALYGGSSASNTPDQQIVGRVGVCLKDNAPIHAGAERYGRILSVIPRGQTLAVVGKTDTEYAIRMIDHSIGYVPKADVKILDNIQAVSDSSPSLQTLGQQLVQIAEGYLGVPYSKYGNTRAGIGDAGLVWAVYASAHLSLPRSTLAQASTGYDVPHNVAAGDWTQWAPGDRLYFACHHPRIDHTGMYIGNGLFIHASVGHNSQVAIDRVDNAYYAGHLVAVRRSYQLLNEPTMPGG